MNQIYIYDGYFEKGEGGWPLIRAAATRYGQETELDFNFEMADITRSESGKPFFVDIPVEFSLSHSGMMWMCLFSNYPCGVDLQEMIDSREENRNHRDIARRMFNQEEQHYAELWGTEGFYEIWVRKEAFGKCTGGGIFSEMPSMVDEQDNLKDVLEVDDVIYQMESIEISPEVKCAVCIAVGATEKEPIEVRILG